MRFVAMQLLTWGTICGAIGSALLLATLERPAENHLAALPLAVAIRLPGEPPQAGRQGRLRSSAKAADTAPSAPNAPDLEGR